jgi:tRNA A37 methylthiotransferase MiaB
MMAYLTQFMVDEAFWTAARQELEATLTEQERERQRALHACQEQQQSHWLQGLVGSGFPSILAMQEYEEHHARLEDERRVTLAGLNQRRQEAVRALQQREEADRARYRAIPFWPYDIDTEVIGDGHRVHQPPAGRRPETGEQHVPEE